MALIKCRECNSKMSSTATKCENCGKLSPSSENIKLVVQLLIVLVLSKLLGWI